LVPGYPATTPDRDFVDTGNGTVRHLATGLIWKRCAEGQVWNSGTCVGDAALYTWQQALARADAVNIGSVGQNAGSNAWRVPNIKELRGLVERGCTIPSINTTQFPSTPAANFWSSSPFAGNAANAWSVLFHSGPEEWLDRRTGARLRLVRAGTAGGQFDAMADSLAPKLSGLRLEASSKTAATWTVTIDKAATLHWLVVAPDAAAPSSEQILGEVEYDARRSVARGRLDMTAARPGRIEVKGLKSGEAYDCYILARDNTVNANTSPVAALKLQAR
jgi:hypothetical protein